MLSRIIDLLILRPTRQPIVTVGRTRRTCDVCGQPLEIWTSGMHQDEDADFFVLKFIGAGGRAERATQHPLDYWSTLRGRLWTVNPPGYGGSPGRASMGQLVQAGFAAYDELHKVADGRPILLSGNSLGATVALRVAAQRDVAGLVLRNPPPIRQVILRRYGWWNLWVGAGIVALLVPRQICSIRNARRVRVPAVFIASGKDRTVPLVCQQSVINAYQGEKQVLMLKDADHATGALSPTELAEYCQMLDWLRVRALGRLSDTRHGQKEEIESRL